ncbi:YgfZ/GcvT domain-containing protein [Aidingimonas halophila]|uniref:GCVT N-terminal domain-containing protein n=1 Tax=Aidingimonas halophila TaxID=574349 RepID=A0A1H3BUV1_9GAMM|nr:folate-binding protein YgfZ [Aidingimonas halophila]GHC27073.1 tRNA-modifying protein YgfZ [Aidingimonas halophila]SDX44939.1 hypothetical protein SAMN05443545_105312 [Aidingimonas halophila]
MTDWTHHLGATRIDERTLTFDTPTPARQALDTTTLSPLIHLGILEVAGADAERFLQGQASAQIDLVRDGFAPLTCFCSPKGRMLANAQVARVGDERFWLILDASLTSSLKQHLDKFAVFYKVEMTHRDDIAMIGLTGADAPALLEARLDIEPPGLWYGRAKDDIQVLRHPGPRPRLLLCLPDSLAIPTWEKLSLQAKPVGNAVWRLHDIQAGLAWLDVSQQDTYLPQMLNWEALGGISFKKGCYTGQEVVARAHFRGQVKKRLVRAQLEGDVIPAKGTSVEDANGKSRGEVLTAELDAYGQVEILAVMTTRDSDTPLSVAGQRFKTLKLPYPIERLDPETLAEPSQ